MIKTQMFDQCGGETWPLVTDLLNLTMPWGEAVTRPAHTGQSALGLVGPTAPPGLGR